jgi:hypothetical protein
MSDQAYVSLGARGRSTGTGATRVDATSDSATEVRTNVSGDMALTIGRVGAQYRVAGMIGQWAPSARARRVPAARHTPGGLT